MYVANAQAKVFTSTMTYEILLIVVIGGIGSVTGSVHRHVPVRGLL